MLSVIILTDFPPLFFPGLLEQKKKHGTLLAFNEDVEWSAKFVYASSLEPGQKFSDAFENESKELAGSSLESHKHCTDGEARNDRKHVVDGDLNSESNAQSVSSIEHDQVQELGSDDKLVAQRVVFLLHPCAQGF